MVRLKLNILITEIEPQKNEYKNPNIVKYEKDILYWDQYLQYKRKECISQQKE